MGHNHPHVLMSKIVTGVKHEKFSFGVECDGEVFFVLPGIVAFYVLLRLFDRDCCVSMIVNCSRGDSTIF